MRRTAGFLYPFRPYGHPVRLPKCALKHPGFFAVSRLGITEKAIILPTSHRNNTIPGTPLYTAFLFYYKNEQKFHKQMFAFPVPIC